MTAVAKAWVSVVCAIAILGGGACSGSDDDGAIDGGAELDAGASGGDDAGPADGGATGIDAELAADAEPVDEGELYDDLEPELQELFDLINEERAAEGVAAVSLRVDLICAAQDHSDDVGEEESCSLEGSDGENTGNRVADCGGDSWFAGSIACGHPTPRAAVDQWLSSAEQRDIMLGEDRAYVGVGVYNNYWTAIYDDAAPGATGAP